MKTEPLRRRSIFPPQSQPAPALTDAEVAAIATRNGFEAPTSLSAKVPESSTPAPRAGMTSRRQRQPTGRDFQFNVRLKQDTIDFIYELANSRNVPIAQIIEEMAAALKARLSATPES